MQKSIPAKHLIEAHAYHKNKVKSLDLVLTELMTDNEFGEKKGIHSETIEFIKQKINEHDEKQKYYEEVEIIPLNS
ncbi:hypothetical protein [Brevibacillus brevis]|uniref:hypothetical protein n=1 Tax=Brevibacillus brevis TaxID=1393 RepID=UPI0007D8BCF3|nr:hypothetical protein [Brevibacillus brevis]